MMNATAGAAAGRAHVDVPMATLDDRSSAEPPSSRAIT